jgi:hypothetical protein
MAQADANANSSWKRVTDAAILFAAMRLEEFTVDDVLDQLADIPGAPGTHNLSAMGPRMKEVSRTLGYMEATDRVKRSRRPEKQGNLHRIWRSLVFKGPAWPAITGRTN